jgi:hypothetical protein
MQYLPVTLLLVIPVIAGAQTLSEKDRKDIKLSMVASCYTMQRSSELNKLASDAQIRYYCSCFAEELITPTTTVQEFHAAIREAQKSNTQGMMRIFLRGRDLGAITNSCSAQAFQFIK